MINPEPLQTSMSPRHSVPIHRYARVTSTIDLAHAALSASSPSPRGLLIVANEQTAGRGTRGRDWQSPTGSLSATLVIPGPARPELGLLVGIAAVDAIGDELASLATDHPPPLLRWPNDVVFDWRGTHRKAGGCLTQWLDSRGKGMILASVGVNLNNPAAELGGGLRTPAIALCEIAGQAIDPITFAGRLADALVEAISARLAGDLLARAEKMLARRGQAVTARGPGGIRSGVVMGLAPDGGLRLRPEQGHEEIVRHSAELDEAEGPDEPDTSPA